MSQWIECTLNDIGEIVGGATPSTAKKEYYGGKIPWITPKDLSSYQKRYIVKGERSITEEGLHSCPTKLLPENTILFTSRAPIGYIAISSTELCTNQGFKSIIPKEDIDKLFVYYLLVYNKNKIISMGSGTTFKEISGKVMKSIEVKIPQKLQHQKKIASILGRIDDKIELNNKINDNLQQQARALLVQWLIKNKGDYEFSLLSNVAVINPDTYSPKNVWQYVNYLDTSSITDGVISEIQHIKLQNEKLPSRARRIITTNDIVFSTVRPNQRHFGLISEPFDNMLASTGFAVIRSNHQYVSNELLYLCLTENSFVEKMQQLAEQSTSTFPSIKPSDLGVCEIPCPIDEGLSDSLKALFAYISSNQRENTSLSTIRDTLLPKLMSGELDVSELDI